MLEVVHQSWKKSSRIEQSLIQRTWNYDLCSSQRFQKLNSTNRWKKTSSNCFRFRKNEKSFRYFFSWTRILSINLFNNGRSISSSCKSSPSDESRVERWYVWHRRVSSFLVFFIVDLKKIFFFKKEKERRATLRQKIVSLHIVLIERETKNEREIDLFLFDLFDSNRRFASHSSFFLSFQRSRPEFNFSLLSLASLLRRAFFISFLDIITAGRVSSSNFFFHFDAKEKCFIDRLAGSTIDNIRFQLCFCIINYQIQRIRSVRKSMKNNFSAKKRIFSKNFLCFFSTLCLDVNPTVEKKNQISLQSNMSSQSSNRLKRKTKSLFSFIYFLSF